MSINIVTSADSNFVRPVAVMLQSVTDFHRGVALNVAIITDSILPEDRASLAEICEITWISPPPDIGIGVELPIYLSVASLWRLSIADLLPAAMDRVIYLDADTLVRGSLQSLWDIELASNTIAAVRDPVAPWFGSPAGPPWERLDLSPDEPYFNSGVMLIDLVAWRRDCVGRLALKVLREVRLPWADQCALNSVLVGKWTQVSPRWNLQAGHVSPTASTATVEARSEMESSFRNPSIVHFNSGRLGRPWASVCSHPFAAEWYAKLSKTEWSRWKPPRRSIKNRVASFYGTWRRKFLTIGTNTK